MKPTDWIIQYIEANRDIFIQTACDIWDHPELAFHEDYACALLTSLLEKEGFRITPHIAGMTTAFIAEYGSGSPVIGIMGEYDALPNLSQVAECTVRTPIVEGGAGHGCGHNLLALVLLPPRLLYGTIWKSSSSPAHSVFTDVLPKRAAAARPTWRAAAYSRILMPPSAGIRRGISPRGWSA